MRTQKYSWTLLFLSIDVYKRQLWHRAPNMDTLVALGSMASFLWSVYVLFAMTRAQVDGDSAAVMNYMMEFYFESDVYKRQGQKRVPLGVIGIIYEARPNVTADAFALCFKTGNVVIDVYKRQPETSPE